jgi:Asp-tRNA(Asn)/Glu-tRNA(Gln) amidotransferase A subunit family amidase
MRYSQFANIMGLPAAVVPAGRSAEGLPIGIQVIGLPYEETTVLDFAEAIAGAGEFAWPAIAQSSRGSGVHP